MSALLVPLCTHADCRTEKREHQREAKAEVAAQLEKSIEKELLERLQKGVYPTDIVNINMKEYEKVQSICCMHVTLLSPTTRCTMLILCNNSAVACLSCNAPAHWPCMPCPPMLHPITKSDAK